jgi:hypothetical protein
VVIRETEVNLAGMTVFVQPLAGLALSVLWVGESLHWGQLWGSLAIIAGLIIALRPERLLFENTGCVYPSPHSVFPLPIEGTGKPLVASEASEE